MKGRKTLANLMRRHRRLRWRAIAGEVLRKRLEKNMPKELAKEKGLTVMEALRIDRTLKLALKKKKEPKKVMDEIIGKG